MPSPSQPITPSKSQTASGQALDGIRIIDLSGTVASAYCGKCFADYGAEVIDLEPSTGFSTRRLPPFTDFGDPPLSAMHAYLSTNKRSVLRDELTEAAWANLVDRAHLVLTHNPNQVPAHVSTLSIDWFGSGPYADYAATDATLFAMNGMLKKIGPAEGPPYAPTGYQAQFVGGATAYLPALAHILGCEMGNETQGARLYASLFEAMLCFTEPAAVAFFNSGLDTDRMGINRFPPTYPLGVFPCADGWLGVTVLTPSQWQSFCHLLDMQDWADVPLFQTSVGRLEASDLIEPRIRDALTALSAEALFYRAQAARVPLARVPTMGELFEIDQFNSRSAFADATFDQSSIKVPSIPFRLHRTPPHFGGPIPKLGEHTEHFQ